MAIRKNGIVKRLQPIPNTTPKRGPVANRKPAASKPAAPKPAAARPPAPARAAAAAGKTVSNAGKIIGKGVQAVKGNGIIKGVTRQQGVAASVGRVASRLVGPAFVAHDAIDRNRNRQQPFFGRAVPTALGSAATGWAGARAGSVAGAKLGSMLGPKGALVGGIAGGLGGGLLGYDAGSGLMDAAYETAIKKPGGASTKSQTIGNGKGGVTKPRGGTPKPQGGNKPLNQVTPKQAAGYVRLGQAQPSDVGNRNSGTARMPGGNTPRPAAPRARLASPAIGAPIHARPQAFGAAQGGLGGSADAPGSVYAPQVPQRPSTPGQAVQQAAAASETYRDGGKGLYQGTEEYRNAVGGSGNPLLNRFRQDMGLDPATGARQDAAPTPQELPAENPYAGIGDLRGLSIKDNVPAVAQNPELAGTPNAQYQGNDEPGKLGQADDPLRALAELLFKNKLKISVN
jgi:hypothetical protein